MAKDDYPLCPVCGSPARRDRIDDGLWHHDNRPFPCRDKTGADPLPHWMQKAMADAFIRDSPLRPGWRDRTVTDVDDLISDVNRVLDKNARRALDDDSDWQ